MSDRPSNDTDAVPGQDDHLRFIDWCFYWRGLRDPSQTTTTPYEEWIAWRADCYRGETR
ncbi:hypothetical protein [Roseimaritima sediminicola]|uniref:hypothetical protein n=1 Tax=Roseimaritima sediminicola TaxID=2662066 RepID=UPI0012984BA8|nr:hypothetical protein [Roseimaritima sediminicola]